MSMTSRNDSGSNIAVPTVIIMTQPLGSNYGGLLQAFALQHVIARLGFSVSTNQATRPRNPMRRVLGQIRSIFVGRIDTRETRAIEAEPRRFMSENIRTIDLFDGQLLPRAELLRSVDVFVVGSDQVWRATYSDVRRHLLDFVPDGITKISYAASFGTDNLLEYDDALLLEAPRLARRFRAVSVRESSGLEICRERWGLEAKWHIDPTMLLSREEWLEVVSHDRENVKPSPGALLTYVLDEGTFSSQVVQAVVSSTSLEPFGLLPPVASSRREYYADPRKYRMMPVSQWLKAFDDAEFVVADSFHGCVFSIIFNKPFIVIGNLNRGLARFTSLLELFGLEDRLVTSQDQITPELLAREIDWSAVNARVDAERVRSRAYLIEHLDTVAN